MADGNFLSKLKELSSMDIKDIGKLFSKNKKEVSSYYDSINKKRKKEKSRLVLSIDIGSHSIKIVEGKCQRNVINVNKCIEVQTPEGAFMDGKIVNEEIIVSLLGRIIRENNIKAKDVIFTTNSSSIINRDVLIPAVAEDEMDTVVKYEIQQYLPINLDDYVIQFIVLDEIVDDNGMKLKVNVTAFPERMALAYYKVIDSLDLNPYSLDVTYNSISKIANHGEYTFTDGQDAGGTVAFVDMGSTAIDVSILRNGKLDFTRMLKIGGDNIDYALSVKMKNYLTTKEALQYKEIDLLDKDESNIQTEIVRDVIDEILEELERIIQFYRNKSKSNIDIMYIFGGVSSIKNIDLYLEEKLNIKVLKIKEIKNVNLGNDALFTEDISLYLNAIGAIIRL